MNFKTTIELMPGDLKNEIKEFRKEVSDLKISLQLTSHLITLKQWKKLWNNGCPKESIQIWSTLAIRIQPESIRNDFQNILR